MTAVIYMFVLCLNISGVLIISSENTDIITNYTATVRHDLSQRINFFALLRFSHLMM